MLFEDRLATVLGSGSAGEQAARKQYRQLLELLGSMPPGISGPLVLTAYHQLAEIENRLPPVERSRILHEQSLCLSNPDLLAHLAESDPEPVAEAMAVARLDEKQWLALIPRLPATACGFLRRRNDLPEAVLHLLAGLDLPRSALDDGAKLEPTPPPETAPPQTRKEDAPEPSSMPCDFSTDTSGCVDWADAERGPLLVGLLLASGEVIDRKSLAAMRSYQPVRQGRAELAGAASVRGEWCMDAVPRFTGSGAFAGYCGRLRRPVDGTARPAAANPAADRMRQVLHELRTPVGAIQGFAEIIQQQLVGAAPNTYRALAADIGVDVARLLAGLDQLDRMVRLDGGAVEASGGGSDMRLIVERTLERLEGVIRPRGARMPLLVSGEDFSVGLGEEDAALLAWRLLSSLAGALVPGELVDLELRSEGDRMELRVELPILLASTDDVFASLPPSRTSDVTAAMFGTGFVLRLARAEASAAGGSLAVEGETLLLALPTLFTPVPAAER